MSKSTYLVKIGSEHFLVKALNINDVFTSLEKEGVKDLELVYCKSLPYFKPKRKPLEDGTLPLTAEELEEFQKIIGYSGISRVFIASKWVYFNQFGYLPCTSVKNYKAFTFLNELFVMEMENA